METRKLGNGPGPLADVRVIELAGQGPVPFGVMMLADLGASVIRIDRADVVGTPAGAPRPVTGRGRRSVALSLKQEEGREAARVLCDSADVLVDPYRPGVLERLGLDPEVVLARNPGLVVARMTGWGQDGPLAEVAGHDLNYIALAGALLPLGDATGPPPVPLNLVGDYGGGGMLLAFGVMTALHERTRSGRGQVVDVAMVDGVASMLATMAEMQGLGEWDGGRATHWLQGSAPWYRSYRAADDAYLTVAAYEAKFYVELLTVLGLDPAEWQQWDESRWPALEERIAAIFISADAATWCERFAGSDACFAPALSLGEAAAHEQLAARSTYMERDGFLQPAPAPRFSRTPGSLPDPGPAAGTHTREILVEAGLPADALLRSGAAA